MKWGCLNNASGKSRPTLTTALEQHAAAKSSNIEPPPAEWARPLTTSGAHILYIPVSLKMRSFPVSFLHCETEAETALKSHIFSRERTNATSLRLRCF